MFPQEKTNRLGHISNYCTESNYGTNSRHCVNGHDKSADLGVFNDHNQKKRLVLIQLIAKMLTYLVFHQMMLLVLLIML